MVDVLDHGYIKIVETWGSDERIIEAARMSTSKGFLGWGPKPCDACGVDYGSTDPKLHIHTHQPGDEKLLKFLWDNKHATPFEMAGAIVEVQAPIFVFREWHRHRTQSYNELSARYTPLPDVNYIPTVARLLMNGGKNKQAQGTGAELKARDAYGYQSELRLSYSRAETLYQDALALGVPKELARVHLPVGRYSRMRASANLRNWLAFLSLRSEKNPGAQWEIRQFANALHDLLALIFPRTLALFDAC